MKITEVKIVGMHNAENVTYKFDNLTYLHGPNGSGKSTVMQAIQLALLGYIPGTNKTKDAIFKHANGHVMSISLKLDDNGSDVSVERSWFRNGKSIGSSVSVVPTEYDLQSVIGRLEMPIFNFNEFIGMTANKLKDWFIDFLPSEDSQTDWDNVLLKSLKENGYVLNDSTEPIYRKMISQAATAIRNKGLTGVDEIRAANEYFKEELSFCKRELDRIQSTIQSLVYYDDIPVEYSEGELRIKISSLDDKRKRAALNKQAEEMNAHLRETLDDLEEAGINTNNPEEIPEYVELKKQLVELEARVTNYESIAKQWKDYIKKAEHDRDAASAELEVRARVIESGGLCPYTSEECQSIQAAIATFKQEEEVQKAAIHTLDAEVQDAKNRLYENAEEMEKTRSECYSISEKIRTIELKCKHRASVEDSMYDILYDVDTEVDYDAEIKELQDALVKVVANERYSEMIKKLSSEKFIVETQVVANKQWINLTGVNGLQVLEGKHNPFDVLGSEMDKYIQAVFGTSVRAAFNVESKANSFSFGIVRDNQYISYNLLSSGEKCMYTLALMMSIVEFSDSQLKLVMVDDLLDHLDDDNIQKLFETLSNIDGIQMIFAGVKPLTGDYVVEIS